MSTNSLVAMHLLPTMNTPEWKQLQKEIDSQLYQLYQNNISNRQAIISKQQYHDKVFIRTTSGLSLILFLAAMYQIYQHQPFWKLFKKNDPIISKELNAHNSERIISNEHILYNQGNEPRRNVRARILR